MKTSFIKLFALTIVLFAVNSSHAQTTQKKTSKTTQSKSKPAASKPKSVPVAVTVTLTSKCEKNVMVYAGSKENLREPKQREVGGLSTNTLYLKTGDVVCIMDAKKK